MKAKRTLVFFGLLAILVLLLSGLFNPAYWFLRGKIQNRNRAHAGIAAEEPDTIDVLVLGDSESYTSVSPLELWQRTGIAAYVCGQSSQRIPETYYMLKSAFKNQNPRLVILETNLLFRNMEPNKNLETSLMEGIQYYAPIFRYHDLWKAAFQEESEMGSFYKGFELREEVVPYEQGEYMRATRKKEPISPYVKWYLDRIRRLCEDRGATLLLLSVPTPKHFTVKKYNAVSEYANRHGLAYLDLNHRISKLGIDWAVDTMDAGDHLNLSGAQKVTAYLAGYLKREYQLKDHRMEEVYKRWNAEAAYYQRKAVKGLETIRKKPVM